jgi:hypothetical protein
MHQMMMLMIMSMISNVIFFIIKHLINNIRTEE